MNETISLRQNSILQLLEKSPLTPPQISRLLLPQYQVSRATLARDLQDLVRRNLIHSTGKARATKYHRTSQNFLLAPISIDEYFKSDPRPHARTDFNFEVLNHLKNLLDDNLKYLNKTKKSLTHQLDNLSTTIARKELERFVIELAWKSSKIEGNTYDLLETEMLITQMKESPGHTREEAIMILNHKSAFETIFHHRNDLSQFSISTLTQLHNILIKDMSVKPGLRQHAVGISGTSYKPLVNQWQIREVLTKLESVINNSTVPFEKALITAAMIAYLQPFEDGNKRTGRMMANAILMAHDLYPLSYRTVDEIKFKRALIVFYEQNSLYPFKKIFLDQYEYALNNYFVTNN